jgi:hypothetical protein
MISMQACTRRKNIGTFLLFNLASVIYNAQMAYAHEIMVPSLYRTHMSRAVQSHCEAPDVKSFKNLASRDMTTIFYMSGLICLIIIDHLIKYYKSHVRKSHRFQGQMEFLNVKIKYDLTKMRKPLVTPKDFWTLGEHLSRYDLSGPNKLSKFLLMTFVMLFTPAFYVMFCFVDLISSIIVDISLRTIDYKSPLEWFLKELSVHKMNQQEKQKLEQCLAKLFFFKELVLKSKLSFLVKTMVDVFMRLTRRYHHDHEHSIDLAALLKLFVGEKMLITQLHGILDLLGECVRISIRIAGEEKPLKYLLIADNFKNMIKQESVTITVDVVEPLQRGNFDYEINIPKFLFDERESRHVYTTITNYKEIKWVSYGSHGDVQPIKAVVRSLSLRGVKLSHVVPVDEDTGKNDLEHLENQDLLPSLRSVSTVQHEVLPLASQNRLVVPASYLGPPGSAIVHGLEPPNDCSEPMTLDIPLMDFTSAALSGRRRENRRCGESLFNIPRMSRNGAYFSRKRPFKHRFPACVAIGSSSLIVPSKLKHLPRPKGDHTELFRCYKKVYCHGGAGTATTAIASGAEVISLSRKLDRRWKYDAYKNLSLHGDDHFTIAALLSESMTDVFSSIYRDTPVITRAIATIIALIGMVLHCVTGVRKILTTLTYNNVDLRICSNLTLIVPESSAYVIAWFLSSELRPLTNVSIQRTNTLCDGPLANLIYYIIAAHPICDITLNKNADFMDLIAGALVVTNDQHCEVWLALSRVWDAVPIYHSALVGRNFRLEATEVNGQLIPKNSDKTFDGKEMLIPLPIQKRDLVKFTGNVGPYGPDCNCHTYIFDILNATSKRSSCWIGYMTLCACLAQTAAPLSLIYLERSTLSIPLFRFIARRIRDIVRAAAPVFDDLTLDEQDLVQQSHVVQWDTSPLGGLFPLPFPHIQDRIEKTLTRVNKNRLTAKELGDVRAALDCCLCCTQCTMPSEEDSCVLCKAVSRSPRSMTPKTINLFSYHLMQGEFCPETISGLKRRLKGWALILDVCIITDILNSDYQSVEVIKHGDETKTSYNFCATQDKDGDITIMPQSAYTTPITPVMPAYNTSNNNQMMVNLVKQDFEFTRKITEFFTGFIIRANIYTCDALSGLSTIMTNYALIPSIDPDDPPVKTRASWGVQRLTTTQTQYVKFLGLLSDTVKLTDIVGQEAMERAIRDLNRHKPANQPALKNTTYTRKVKLPTMSTYAKGRRNRALIQLEAEIGKNHLEFATGSNIFKSLLRYAIDKDLDAKPDQEYDDAVNALLSAVPKAFENHHLKTPEFVARSIVWKFSCGVPFEGNDYLKQTPFGLKRATLRRRLDLRRSGWLKSVVSLVHEQLTSGEIPNDLHHAFVKNYISTKEKLEADPGGIRTVVAQELSSYVRNMVFNYSLDKRMTQVSESAPWAVGTRLSGGGYNKRFSNRTSKRKHWVIDGKAFDSNVSHKVLQAVAKVRGEGFSNHPEHESIKTWFSSNMLALEKSTMYDIYNQQYVPHEKGHTTGQSSVTTTNQIAVLLILSRAYSASTGKSEKEFFELNQIDAMGEDVHIGSDMSDAEMKGLLTDAEKQGVTFRIEGEADTLIGLEWCRKKFENPAKYKEDFELIDMPLPTYALVHDPESIAMRQTASAHKDTASFYYARTIGHALLAAHNKPLYKWLKQEADMLKPLLAKTRGGRAWLKNVKFPSYKTVLSQYYQIPPDRSTPVKFQDPFMEYLRHEKQACLGITNFARSLRSLGLKHMAGKRVTSGTDTLFQPPANILAAAIRDVHTPATTREEMRAKISLGPASSVINVDYFWDHQSNAIGYMENNVASGVILTFEILTVLVSNAFNSMKKIPILRVFLYVHSLAYREGVHIYGLFSGFYYAANGRPSSYLATFAQKRPIGSRKKNCFIYHRIFFFARAIIADNGNRSQKCGKRHRFSITF